MVNGEWSIVETVQIVQTVEVVEIARSRLPFDELPGTAPGTGRTEKAAPTREFLSSDL